MGKKKKRKIQKEWGLFPLEMVYTIRKIIRMYARIAMDKKVKWICLCNANDWLSELYEAVGDNFPDSKSVDTLMETYQECRCCPASSGLPCQGPGGSYKEIKNANRNKRGRHPGHIREAATQKAVGWTEWFEKQKLLWSFMGYEF